MANIATVTQQQQNFKSKRQKRAKSSSDVEPLEGLMSESQAKYLQELRQIWEDAS